MTINADDIHEVDSALKDWRQGDCTLDENQFIYRCDPEKPLSTSSRNPLPVRVQDSIKNTEFSISEVKGFVVVSQTCDIVRNCMVRPFIEVIPLIAVDSILQVARESRDSFFSQVRKGQRLQYVYIPGVEEFDLVGDLDRIMTVEKSVVARWERIEGWKTDNEIREIGKALKRRGRFAYPDDFVELVSNLRNKLSEKHNKKSPEGEALRSLREIRVIATPSWKDDEIELMFLFVREEEPVDFLGTKWNDWRELWLQRVPASGRFKVVDGIVTTLADMTGQDYVDSEPLALDHLSSS